MMFNAHTIVVQLHEGQAAYWRLVAELRAGRRLSAAVIRDVLAASGKSAADLLGHVATIEGSPPRPGDVCAACGVGKLRVANTVRTKAKVVRYLGCPACGSRPQDGKQVLPAAEVPRRKPKNTC